MAFMAAVFDVDTSFLPNNARVCSRSTPLLLLWFSFYSYTMHLEVNPSRCFQCLFLTEALAVVVQLVGYGILLLDGIAGAPSLSLLCEIIITKRADGW